MRIIITEEMKFRKKVVEYAIKHNNNALAARRYHTSRQQVQRWRKKYDGTIQSLANKSRRPHSHPNQHTEEELELIKQKLRYHGHEGHAQVYKKLLEAGYKRSFGSMSKQIRKMRQEPKPKKRKRKTPRKTTKTNYPGELVQVDVKYVPLECIGFESDVDRYYQITAIDVFTRKRYIKLVKEHSTYETAKFALELEKKLGFKIKTIQTDNGKEFTNNSIDTPKTSLFQKALKKLGIKHITTRPYSPWQNGHVERSHRTDNELFYDKKRFKSEEEMYEAHKRYNTRTNNIAKQVLGFKTPNEILEEFKNAA